MGQNVIIYIHRDGEPDPKGRKEKAMFAKFFKKEVKKVVATMYRVTYEDGEVLTMDGAGLNMAIVHDYDGQIVKVEKL